ncbi:ricin B lectin domain-containing protein [Spinellus fusiger]|nr:ricin B lectin domain-containing protein [Spinellus fusiger]
MHTHIPTGFFYIVSQFNGLVLDVEGASQKDGAKICVWKKKTQDADNQLWEFRHSAFINRLSGKVLDVKDAKIKHDTAIIQYEKKSSSEDSDNQHWIYSADGYIHTAADPSLVLDIRGAEDKEGTPVILYKKREGGVASNQRWILEPANL